MSNVKLQVERVFLDRDGYVTRPSSLKGRYFGARHFGDENLYHVSADYDDLPENFHQFISGQKGFDSSFGWQLKKLIKEGFVVDARDTRSARKQIVQQIDQLARQYGLQFESKQSRKPNRPKERPSRAKSALAHYETLRKKAWSVESIISPESPSNWKNAIDAALVAADAQEEIGEEKKAAKLRKWAETYEVNAQRDVRSQRNRYLLRSTPKKSRARGRIRKTRKTVFHSARPSLLQKSRSSVSHMAGRPKRRKRRYGSKRKSRRDWFGQPIRHKRAAKLGWSRRRRAKKSRSHSHSHRTSTFGRARYSTAKRGGYRKKKRYSAKYSAARKRNRTAAMAWSNRRRRSKTTRRDWPGQPRRHKWAAELGWSRKSKKRRGGKRRRY